MIHRITTLLGVGLLVATAAAPQSLADPAADPPVQPATNAAPPAPVPGAPAAPIASASPGTLSTPDGWVLTVQARNESMEPVASLTNSPWSREYLVDGSFEGTVTGGGKTKLSGGTLEAGYQIGCGITQDDIESISTVTGIAGLGILQVRKRPARMGRNPATGEAIKIKASKKVAFRAAKELKESI
jgi:hypothetical protein